jgi:hypothetical protein
VIHTARATASETASEEVKRRRADHVRQLTTELEAELGAERLDRWRVRRLVFELQRHRDGMRRYLTRELRASAGGEAAAVTRQLLSRPSGEAREAWVHARACHVDQVATNARRIGQLIDRAQYTLERTSIARRVLRALCRS